MEKLITFPNGVKILNDGREIIFPNGERIFTDVFGEKITKDEYLSDCGLQRYFDPITEKEREVTLKYCNSCMAVGLYERETIGYAKNAAKRIDYSYSIANLEPSISNDKIFYREGEVVCTNLNYREWLRQAKEFAPEYNSDLAFFDELILYYMYRVAKGYWTLDEVCHRTFNKFGYLAHLSGESTIGGARDGVGNTQKLVKSAAGVPILYGNAVRCIEIKTKIGIDEPLPHASGVIVMRKLIA